MQNSEQKAQSKSIWPEVAKLAALIFLPLFVLISISAFHFIHYTIEQEESIIIRENESRVATAYANASTCLDSAFADIRFLANSESATNFAEDMSEENAQALTRNFLSFSTHKGIYDQVRFLDLEGMERVRVNFNNGYPSVVEKEKLQSKKHRYYFDDALPLEAEQIFVSPLDLNIEHKQIETPLKPMIRLSTPVYDRAGNKRGIMILNYLAHVMLDATGWADTKNNRIMLLNNKGYWLRGPNPDMEWGFMYSDGKDKTFAVKNPEAWNTISEKNTGSFMLGDELFVFRKILPTKNAMTGTRTDDKKHEIRTGDLAWIVLVHIPENILSRRLYMSRNVNLAAFAMGAFLCLALSTMLAYRTVDKKRRERERQQRESAEEWSKTFDSITDMITIISKERKVLRANRAFKEHFGDACNEGSYCQEMFGKTRLPVLCKNCKIFETGQPMRVEVEESGDDGRCFDLSMTAVFDEEGHVKEVIHSLRDITDSKKLEIELRQSEKMQAVGQLAGGIAHDFNNQLAAIMGYSELLEDNLKDNPQLRRFACMISKSGSRAAGLTRQLLAYSRKGKTRSIVMNVHEIIEETILLLSRSLDKRIKIETNLLAEKPLVVGDPSQVQNAMLNLGINARDAMVEGGVLTYRTTNTQLDEVYCGLHPYKIDPGAYLQISVTDTGTGIPKDIQKKIFDPFFTTKAEGKGTGMGLAAVYGTVKAHKGAINLYSEPGKGSTFNIYLPLTTQEAGKTGMFMLQKPITGTGTILVIDDEEIVRQMACDMLESLGYTTYQAADGNRGIAILRDNHDDICLVLMDIIMPDKGGRDTFVDLRMVCPDIPVVIASGYSVNEEAQRILDMGANGFIQKPYQKVELSVSVAEALGRDIKQLSKTNR